MLVSRWGGFWWNDADTKFHENPSNGSNVIRANTWTSSHHAIQEKQIKK
jgi:hypothetical protein